MAREARRLLQGDRIPMHKTKHSPDSLAEIPLVGDRVRVSWGALAGLAGKVVDASGRDSLQVQLDELPSGVSVMVGRGALERDNS